MKAILLNGPPRSGKDEIYRIIQSLSDHRHSIVEVHHHKFAAALSESVARLFGYDPLEWASVYASKKDEPLRRLRGMSPRGALIWMAETVVKPKFGDDFFGVSLAAKIESELDSGMMPNGDGDLIVISDCGFIDEVQPIVTSIGVDNCFLVHTEREGRNFKDDSRGYLGSSDLCIPESQCFRIVNDGGISDLECSVATILTEIGYSE
ncbi:MAG: hypothetical protein CMF22_11475 [Idiomarinaceae bacterium]|nr:hypothetical protein [Idiomarinaceae bacterium]|tara:strand:- start:86148 stop:86768 length:621 start_codon:yes stop_codon:yes gene_type:complete